MIEEALETVDIKPSVKSFAFESRQVELILPDEFEVQLRSLLKEVLELTEKEGTIDDLVKRVKELEESIVSLDEAKLIELGVPQGLIKSGNKENIKAFIYKNKFSLSEEETKTIMRGAIQKYDSRILFLINRFISGQLTVEEKNTLFTALNEADTYLEDLLKSSGIEQVMKNIQASERWQLIKQLKTKITLQEDEKTKTTKNMEVVFAKKNLLDLFQGKFSGTCFGDCPYDMARKEILVVKVLDEGDLAGGMLFYVLGDKLVMIGFDPSEALVGSLSKEKREELADYLMSAVYEFAQENNFKFYITDEAGDLSNREGMEEHILGKIIEEIKVGESVVKEETPVIGKYIGKLLVRQNGEALTSEQSEQMTFHPDYQYKVTTIYPALSLEQTPAANKEVKTIEIIEEKPILEEELKSEQTEKARAFSEEDNCSACKWEKVSERTGLSNDIVLFALPFFEKSLKVLSGNDKIVLKYEEGNLFTTDDVPENKHDEVEKLFDLILDESSELERYFMRLLNEREEQREALNAQLRSVTDANPITKLWYLIIGKEQKLLDEYNKVLAEIRIIQEILFGIPKKEEKSPVLTGPGAMHVDEPVIKRIEDFVAQKKFSEAEQALNELTSEDNKEVIKHWIVKKSLSERIQFSEIKKAVQKEGEDVSHKAVKINYLGRTLVFEDVDGRVYDLGEKTQHIPEVMKVYAKVYDGDEFVGILREYVEGTRLDEVESAPEDVIEQVKNLRKRLNDELLTHGDYYSRNILLTKEGKIKLIDLTTMSKHSSATERFKIDSVKDRLGELETVNLLRALDFKNNPSEETLKKHIKATLEETDDLAALIRTNWGAEGVGDLSVGAVIHQKDIALTELQTVASENRINFKKIKDLAEREMIEEEELKPEIESNIQAQAEI